MDCRVEMRVVVSYSEGQSQAVYCRKYGYQSQAIDVSMDETHHVDIVIVTYRLYLLHKAAASWCSFGILSKRV